MRWSLELASYPEVQDHFPKSVGSIVCFSATSLRQLGSSGFRRLPATWWVPFEQTRKAARSQLSGGAAAAADPVASGGSTGRRSGDG